MNPSPRPIGAPRNLRCDGCVNPLGIDSDSPRLSWQLEPAKYGHAQTASQVLAASSLEKMEKGHADLWDSGKVDGEEPTRYNGPKLPSSKMVFWKVRIWDASGACSPWSEINSWMTGIVNEEDWQARWISQAGGGANANRPMAARRIIALREGLLRATLYVCGLGQHYVEINGKQANESLITPGWTASEKTCLYDTLDITGLLATGNNEVIITVAGGMYRVPDPEGRYRKFTGPVRPYLLIAQLRLEYQDGTVETVGTNELWETGSGPVTYAHIYGGEDFDARENASGWSSSAVIASGPGGRLRGTSDAAPAVTAHEVLPAVSVANPKENTLIHDFGQNASMMPRLRVIGQPGTVIKMIPSELLTQDGLADRRSVGGGACWWSYTLRGGGEENWFPRFFYHGARYLQVEIENGDIGQFELLTIEAVVVHSAAAPVGRFACSDDLFNRIHKLIRWAQRSNLASLITDCPHRERLGWLEQYHLNGPSLRCEFDLTRLYTKCFGDMADAQTEEGLIPNIAPEFMLFTEVRDSPEWGSAFILAAWQQYVWTGDDTSLFRHYEAMKRYHRYLERRASGHIVEFGLGDWFDIGPGPLAGSQLTPIALTGTAIYHEDTVKLAAIARVIGRDEDALYFNAKAEEIRHAFNDRFYNPAKGSYSTGSQSANALPLVIGLVEPANRQAVLENLVRDIRERGNAVTAGDVGYRYVLRALAENGRSDVIYDLNHHCDKPGYGYQLAQGATSLTEAWNATPESSQNHFMLGQIMEWFYQDLCGLAPDPEAPGFRNVIVRPQPVAAIDWAEATHESPRGKIFVGWRKRERSFELDVEIPPNATATIHVPTSVPDQVQYTGPEYIKQISKGIYKACAGKFRFTAPL